MSTKDDNEISCPHCKKVFKIDQSGYANIIQQVRDVEFNKDLDIRVEERNNLHKSEIGRLKLAINQEKQIEIVSKNKQIDQLKAEVNSGETEKKLAVTEAESKHKEEISGFKEEISGLVTAIKIKDEEMEVRKNLKLKMSVKEIGENFEIWCENQFNILRQSAFPNAYFEKDNQAIKEEDEKKGSKGDYIFREKDSNDIEFVSIMFEMKDKMDATDGTTNDSHLEKLDKDRKKKNCEYAVLVSMLEQDNELYNSGIIDKSHKYDKMYVVRPPNFITILTLIRNQARKSLEIRNELAAFKRQNIEVESFYNELNLFKEGFGKNYNSAKTNYDKAKKGIEDTITKLEGILGILKTYENQLRLGNDKAQDLTIKKLTKDSPTLKAEFDELKEKE